MKRQQQLNDWLTSLYPDQPFSLAPASADASFRRYFRATFADRTLVVMDAPTQHEDCRPFIRIANALSMNSSRSPSNTDCGLPEVVPVRRSLII